MTIYHSTNARPCASCAQPRGACLSTCPDMPPLVVIPGPDPITIDGMSVLDAWFGPDTFVEEPQRPVQRRTRAERSPAWARLFVAAGGLLLALTGASLVWTVF